jgi:hypothetical protein
MQTKLIFSQEDSLANPTQRQENASVKMMNAICGQRCLEQFERFNHVGSWAKMFAGFLVGTGEWYSTRCRLTWKIVGTKSSRLYFQLVPKMLPTEGTEFGLWPTVTSVQRDHPERVEKLKATGATTMMSRKAGENRPNSVLDMAMFTGLLKTPTKMDGEVTSGKKNPKSGNSGTLAQELMSGYPPTMEKLGLLPTPTAQVVKHGHSEKYWDNRIGKRQMDIAMWNAQANGKTSQLNPLFVEEMMGFPENWTLSPFLSGETNQSKPTETR